jgi:hypothetical protein
MEIETGVVRCTMMMLTAAVFLRSYCVLSKVSTVDTPWENGLDIGINGVCKTQEPASSGIGVSFLHSRLSSPLFTASCYETFYVYTMRCPRKLAYLTILE